MQSRNLRPVVEQPGEELPRHISNPCHRGDHGHCLGRVALAELKNNRRFARCECAICEHPAIRTMPIKD